ncbi:E3 ubiquitin-protein ligase listerin [Henckelia pumila]|uniref:E3 ubiquitin-protein ligase listerin n=1 Tax=Henckelia pumila TaxID=405737 RepID=UPI003C6DFC45
MGRTKGEAARSKSRPSSSSEAASLLPSSATTVGFGGYVGSSRVDSSLASTSDGSTFLEIDGELAVQLKRLSRKDPTTKLKALSSLSQLIAQKSALEIVAIIPQWAFEYRKLLMDYSREVRRATNDTMTNLVTVVGRELAPHLKPLIGPWWFSQFDSVYEVSQAAKRSFQTAFPAQERRLDALMLYSSEIFMYIEENLKLTPQSLSDKANASDELEEMHQQVVSSSLLALAAILDVILSPHSERSGSENISGESKLAIKARTKAASSAEKLFSAHKYFLNFLKSPTPAIRSAAYSMIRSCIKNIPHAISEGDMRTLAATILGSFQEKNPACHSSMWDTVLLWTKTFPDSWTFVNVQKTILSRLWNFLKNGCFGSQQVSYPALLLFLEIVPSKAIAKDSFFLDLFQNFWEGRNLACSSNADRLAFFLAAEECFLWGLRNASRYCDEVDSVYSYQCSLVDDILLGLLWHEYLQVSGLKNKDLAYASCTSNRANNSIQPIHKDSREAMNCSHSPDYEKSLGTCIIKILSGINFLQRDLLLIFRSRFQADCLDIFQKMECSLYVESFVNFFVLLGQHAMKREKETWPLFDLVGPTLKKVFSIIGTSDSPDPVTLVLVAVSIFGSREIVRELMGVELGTEQFLQYFNKDIIPWCLKKFSPSTDVRVDLLLALLLDVSFSEQWDAIVTYLVNCKDSDTSPSMMNRNHIDVFTILMEKVRDRTAKIIHKSDSCEIDWHHELLDSLVVSVVCSVPLFEHSIARFLCAAIGGRSEDDKISFVSQNTLILVFEEVFRKLMTFMMDSPFIWVQDVCSMLLMGGSYRDWRLKSSNNLLETAYFILDILNGSLFCLKILNTESEVVQGILSAVFIIDWEFSWITVSKDQLDEDELGKMEARFGVCDAVHAFCGKVCDQFMESIGLNGQKSLGSVLIQLIKRLANLNNGFDSDGFISFCCQRVLDIFEFLCKDQVEEQKLLDQLLCESDSWPLWIISGASTGARLETEIASLQESKNANFVALVDKLISNIGFDRVVAGAITTETTSSINSHFLDSSINRSIYSRPWLAAEILCTWKWLGGSALHSLLTPLCEYIKNGDSSFSDSVFNILLDGALVHGYGSGLNLLWTASFDEVEAVQEPFLRALISLLSAYFQNNVWGKERAISLFNQLLNLLCVGDTTNLNCLRILPSVMNVLVRTLKTLFEDCANGQSDTSSQNELHQPIVDWLRRVASFPPLNAWKPGDGLDMEDWFQLIVSCFPVKVIDRMHAIKAERYASPIEKAFLYELFQKQRNDGLSVGNKLPLVEMLLSKLMVIAVAYCWEDFDDDDWKFVLHRLRFWIESAVVMMEESAEIVNDTVTSGGNDINVTFSIIENAVETKDPFPIELARNALVAFSLLRGPMEPESKDSENLNPLADERWEFIMDRMLESILRLFFSSAAAEAIADSCCSEASYIVASSRVNHPQLWELVASCVVQSSSHAREKAMKAMEIWGLSKGPISSLYSLVFSCNPHPAMQYAAFVLLSNETMAQLALIPDTDLMLNNGISNKEVSHNLDTTSVEIMHLREEVSCKLQILPGKLLQMDFLAHDRVNVFLAWCLLLSHLASLPSSSSLRERMIQYVQDFTNATVLDCLFQHIPLELCMGNNSRKKEVEIPAEVSEAASAAVRAITSSSVLFCVESLWPIGPNKMASLAGAVFGLMLHNLPAYVRGWFSEIRDRSVSSAIESFTKAWCSPTLISNELSEIKKASFADDNFSVSVSRSANEIVATYTKDETGMDLVIRLPQSYPLKPVDIDCTRSLGISEVKRRKWLMSLMSFIRNQNGALAEAIRIWKSNFDKEFEGVEECPICYSVIHTVNHSLPRLACKTCKHKFHSACLYKWFSTSHKSTCPLCQSPF